MNYHRIYHELITHRQTSPAPKNIYCEKHHIIPASFGGTNAKDNIVRLTAREHFIAHRLLYKIYPKNFGMLKALLLMVTTSGRGQQRFKPGSSKLYFKIREEFSKKQSEMMKGSLNPMFGKHQSEYTKQRLRESRQNRDFTGDNNTSKRPDVRQKISEKKKGAGNHRSKLWTLTCPNGDVHTTIGGIKDFLKSFGLDHQNIWRKRNGFYMGYVLTCADVE